MTATAGSGHYMSSLSCVEILAYLFLHKKILNNGDKFILSKGHAVPALYATLHELGLYSQEDLMTLRNLNSKLQGHPKYPNPGIHMSTGSLGMGIGTGLGMALASPNKKVYVLVGDGELQEGSNWEAIMAAGHYLPHNLIVIVDKNEQQYDGYVDEVVGLPFLDDKFNSFGWKTTLINGHSFYDWNKLDKSMFMSDMIRGPKAIIARTTKGRGVSFLENNLEYAVKPLPQEKVFEALKEIENG
jgi:transketolase